MPWQCGTAAQWWAHPGLLGDRLRCAVGEASRWLCQGGAQGLVCSQRGEWSVERAGSRRDRTQGRCSDTPGRQLPLEGAHGLGPRPQAVPGRPAGAEGGPREARAVADRKAWTQQDAQPRGPWARREEGWPSKAMLPAFPPFKESCPPSANRVPNQLRYVLGRPAWLSPGQLPLFRPAPALPQPRVLAPEAACLCGCSAQGQPPPLPGWEGSRLWVCRAQTQGCAQGAQWPCPRGPAMPPAPAVLVGGILISQKTARK